MKHCHPQLRTHERVCAPPPLTYTLLLWPVWSVTGVVSFLWGPCPLFAGPNLFWTLTALEYAKVTGDMEWYALCPENPSSAGPLCPCCGMPVFHARRAWRTVRGAARPCALRHVPVCVPVYVPVCVGVCAVCRLEGYMPKLRSSVGFLLGFLDPKTNLLSVPGSLFIDVFIRQNYTSE